MIRRAKDGESGAIAATLGRAFQNDPAYIAMFPTDRVARTTKMLKKILDVVYLAKNDVWVSDDLRAVAAWAPPDQWQVPFGKQLRLLTLAGLLGTRSLMALRMLGDIERKHPKTPHHYLAFLGVDPDAQGQGLGSKVLAPVLSRGGDFYLETTNPTNHAFYRRQGFGPIDHVELPEGVRATLMMRSDGVTPV